MQRANSLSMICEQSHWMFYLRGRAIIESGEGYSIKLGSRRRTQKSCRGGPRLDGGGPRGLRVCVLTWYFCPTHPYPIVSQLVCQGKYFDFSPPLETLLPLDWVSRSGVALFGSCWSPRKHGARYIKTMLPLVL